MDVQLYLERIDFESNVPPLADLKTLQVLQNCHQTSVPFENFDAMKGTITNLRKVIRSQIKMRKKNPMYLKTLIHKTRKMRLQEAKRKNAIKTNA